MAIDEWTLGVDFEDRGKWISWSTLGSAMLVYYSSLKLR